MRDEKEFLALREQFCSSRGMAPDDLSKQLIAKDEPLTREWKAALRTLTQYCVECHKEHKPTADCVPCEFSPGFLHKPMPAGIYFDFKGWRFTPPFLCMYCGREICHNQWAFARACGRCDVGRGPRTDKIFSGPRLLIDHDAPYFLEEGRFYPDGTKPLEYPKERPRFPKPNPRQVPRPRIPRREASIPSEQGEKC